MSQALDPRADVFSRGTSERDIIESVELLGPGRINVTVPVLTHRFARERLKALARMEDT